MNTSSFIKVLAILLVLILIGVGILFLLKGKTDTTQVDDGNGGGVTFPVGGNDNNDGDPSDIQTTAIQEVLSRPETVDLGEGAYIIAGGFDLQEEPPYTIEYYAADGSFTIGLQELPLQATRISAENAFLQLLGITKEEACKETVMVTVPYDVSTEYSGRDLKMSFCPGAVPLK